METVSKNFGSKNLAQRFIRNKFNYTKITNEKSLIQNLPTILNSPKIITTAISNYNLHITLQETIKILVLKI